MSKTCAVIKRTVIIWVDRLQYVTRMPFLYCHLRNHFYFGLFFDSRTSWKADWQTRKRTENLQNDRPWKTNKCVVIIDIDSLQKSKAKFHRIIHMTVYNYDQWCMCNTILYFDVTRKKGGMKFLMSSAVMKTDLTFLNGNSKLLWN